MTSTQVRLLSDGEELVIEEGHDPFTGSSEPQPREASFARRSQSISDDNRFVLQRQQAWAVPPSGKERPHRGHGNMVAGESAMETPGLTALDVERARSMTDEGGALTAIVESADVETKAL